MKVKILKLLDGAKQARGLTVIVDVFRAFSVACYAFNNGVEKIVPIADIDIAYDLKNKNPDYILLGERKGEMPKGFDYGNSPTQIENVDFTNKTIIHTTSAGTQGIANATNADEIITGSFVNAQAIIDYINEKNPEEVSLIAMGKYGIHITDEDELCVKYIKNALESKANNFPKIVEHLRTYISAHKFFDSSKDWAPEKDFDLCLSLNKFNFILKAEPYDDNHVYLMRIDM